MVSSAAYAKPISSIAKPVLLPLSIAALAYAAYQGRANGIGLARQFFTGPGNKSRIFALFMVVYNWKSLPLAWTVRIFNTMIQHLFVRPFHAHGPEVLFHPVISTTHVSLLEVDYNIHKSNSTYFADLDVSRSHLASHLFARGIRALGNNEQTRLVLDPSDPSRPAKGRFGVSLGAVHCSFKRELKPYQQYELWTRVLSWDRKWLYLVTHFVEAGTVKPKSWDDGGSSHGGTSDEPQEWEKKIFATAVSKYVWKMGRLTVHPAVVIEASGLLPARPDGWVSTQSSGMVTPAEPVTGNTDEEAKEHDAQAGWDWRRVENERLRGYEFAQHFAAVDNLAGQFDAGENGALGRFSLG
ncbi:capsule polysaccharide biosynthesis protein [Truncatella angustata]|uniref:Capsule polysaccharide biosynthesis protein n=1 Tax=Truncatella angustata TaxID=152316 RepID=A0A9P8UPS9_9PEZI|nr:capsule polysaccharide biosynthesis protein [Truncatella angustata]KAH6656117.1 capsule polysaccharide biosynthesis protein [Truncatella angustata]